MDTMTQIRPIVQRPRRIALTAGPAAAGEARSHVRAAIDAWHVPIDPYVAVLLTSELVTDAIKHKAGWTFPPHQYGDLGLGRREAVPATVRPAGVWSAGRGGCHERGTPGAVRSPAPQNT